MSEGSIPVRGQRHDAGKLDGERGPHARLALDADGAAVGADDPLGDVEAEAKTA